MKKILITGGCGFIGSNLVRYLLDRHPDRHFVNLDALTYAGRRENLADLEGNPRYTFVHGHVEDRKLVDVLMKDGVEAVMHLAAESHVDRSIDDASAFIRTNVEGTQVLLDAARKHGVHRFILVSTDEVYGSLGAEGKFREDTPISPNSPYSASKAAADMLALAAYHTHGLPVCITRCSNNYGPYQYPEKMVPLFITNLMEEQAIPVYGDGLNVRDWIHVIDHCRAIESVWLKGQSGEVYNVGSNNELSNIDLTRRILRELGHSEVMIRYVKDRPGHDRRYAIDHNKITFKLGWEPTVPFGHGLKETINWYRQNKDWWHSIKLRDPKYREFYERHYGHPLQNAAG